MEIIQNNNLIILGLVGSVIYGIYKTRKYLIEVEKEIIDLETERKNRKILNSLFLYPSLFVCKENKDSQEVLKCLKLEYKLSDLNNLYDIDCYAGSKTKQILIQCILNTNDEHLIKSIINHKNNNRIEDFMTFKKIFFNSLHEDSEEKTIVRNDGIFVYKMKDNPTKEEMLNFYRKFLNNLENEEKISQIFESLLKRKCVKSMKWNNPRNN